MFVRCVFEPLFYANLTIILNLQIKTMIKDGKIYQFFESNWHYLLFGIALFAGVLCGVRACSKSIAVDVNARRNVITISKTK